MPPQEHLPEACIWQVSKQPCSSSTASLSRRVPKVLLLILAHAALLAKPRAPAGRSPSSTVCFPTLTSPAHPPEKGFAEFANCHFQVVFPLEKKQELARVGREQVLNPNCCNSTPNPAITSPWDTQSTSIGFLPKRDVHTQHLPGHRHYS